MKIYFTASLTGKKLYEDSYRKIVFHLERLGCKVFSEHIFSSTKPGVCEETIKERTAYLQLLGRNLKWCDAVVSEVSYPSTSTGYEICSAVKNKKPILALHQDKKINYPTVLKALKEEEAVIAAYDSENLKGILESFLAFIDAKVIEKRFTMLLPPEMTDFLDKVVEKESLPRSVIIRNLISERMNKEE